MWRERLQAGHLLLQESEYALGILRGDHWSHPRADLEDEGLRLLWSTQIQREPVPQVPRPPQASLASQCPHVPFLHALDLGVRDALASGQREVIVQNGEPIEIEFDETIIVKNFFCHCENLFAVLNYTLSHHIRAFASGTGGADAFCAFAS